jgi:DNA-binding NarL/FixJ family response regulator
MKRESTKRILTTIRDVLAGNLGVSEQVMAHFSQKFIGGRYMADRVPFAELSDRELEIFNLLGLGLASRKIAQTLDVNIKTVQAHCANIKQKLGLSTATELLREATKWSDSSSAF